MVTSVQSTTSSTAAQAVTGAAAASSSAGAIQSQFLKMLVAQMKNQDPLNPMDNAQVTSQMAQLSTVDGISQLNSTVQALSSSMLASQSLQAVSMIGHAVLVSGKQIDLTNGKANAALNLTQPADSVSVTITDAAGKVVRTMQLGAQNSGMVGLQWDGSTDSGATAADGSYQFSATAVSGGKASSASTLSYGLVNSVAQTQSGVTVNVGQLGDISLTSIQQIL